jgi:hypothetical protein
LSGWPIAIGSTTRGEIVEHQLPQPTEELVRARVRIFDGIPGYAVTDRALSKLFGIFPRNDSLDEILLKVATLNSFYGTNIFVIYPVAEHIHACNIDDRLSNFDLNVVEEIAKVTTHGKVRRNYSFASKYCSFHCPEAYPIYDSFVDQILWRYHQRDSFSRFSRSELFQSYSTFRRVIEDFRTYYGLSNLSLKEVDKFLWLCGKEFNAQASSKPAN